MDKKTVTIIGSYNIALFLKSKRLPSVGETVIADEYIESVGGKGSNQAVVAARFGADTRFIGRIGTDSHGKKGLEMYKELGIATDFIIIDENAHSGIGISFVDKDGRNMISVAPGANYYLSKEDIDSAENAIKDSFIVGFQLQNSLDTVFYGIRKAYDLGVMTFLDPSPVTEIPEELYACIDIIKPNDVEASILTGIPVSGRLSAEASGEWFVRHGVRAAIVTLGAGGAVLVTDDKKDHFPAPIINAVDTTGAGDVFIGSLLAMLSNGKSFEEAIPFAVHAGALATRGYGVVDCIPDTHEVIELMNSP